MRVFDKVMEQMTPEIMAELGVKLVSLNNTTLYYMTSSGQLFDYDKYRDALTHEYNWLIATFPTNDTAEADEAVESADAAEAE